MIVVAAGLDIIVGLFWVYGTYDLRVDDIFFVLCLGSILLIGDSGLLSMFRSIFGLCWLTLGSILVTCIDDLDGL